MTFWLFFLLATSVAGLNVYGFTGSDVTLKCKSNILRGKVTWKYINKSIPGSHWKRIATVSAAGSTNIAVRSPFVGRIKVQSNGNLKISKVNFQDNVRIMCEVSGGNEANILTQRTFFKFFVPNCLKPAEDSGRKRENAKLEKEKDVNNPWSPSVIVPIPLDDLLTSGGKVNIEVFCPGNSARFSCLAMSNFQKEDDLSVVWKRQKPKTQSWEILAIVNATGPFTAASLAARFKRRVNISADGSLTVLNMRPQYNFSLKCEVRSKGIRGETPARHFVHVFVAKDCRWPQNGISLKISQGAAS